MKVALIAPTINEIAGLREIFPRLPKDVLDEIIVVDLNSTDGTVEYCKEHGYRVHHQQSRGYGAGILEALRETSADIIIEFPPDGSSLPEKIPDLLAKINEGYDVVVASRYRDGAKSYDDDMVTRLGNWLFTTMINVLFGAHYTDTLVGFRAYRHSAHNRLALSTRGLSWTAQQSIQYAKAGLKVAEIGVDEPARIGGVRKMRPLKTGLEVLWVIVREFLAGKRFANVFPVESASVT
jgi:glycosyltransferase involved in cell wall biosynthesis